MGTLVFWLVLAAAEPNAGGLTLAGRVSNSSGGAVAGARVDISTAAPRIGRGLFCPSCYADCAKRTRTDAAGRFQIADVNRGLRFRVLVTAPSKQAQLTELVDPLAGDIAVVLEDMPADAPIQRTVRGQVVDDLGTPIEGALVSAAGAATAEKRWWGGVDVPSTVTDTAGRFVTLLPDGYRSVDLEITADGYAGASFEQLRPGAGEQKIAILAGTAVTGRLVRDAQPMAGLRVAVVQIDRGASHHFIGPIDDVTDDDRRRRAILV